MSSSSTQVDLSSESGPSQAPEGDQEETLTIPEPVNLKMMMQVIKTPNGKTTEQVDVGQGSGSAVKDRNGRDQGQIEAIDEDCDPGSMVEAVDRVDGNGNNNENVKGKDEDENEDEEMAQAVAGDVEIGSEDESGHGSTEPEPIACSSSSFEPIAGPSGINVGASTSGLQLPSSFEDEEEGKRPRKKVCSAMIDYNDYYFDDEEYNSNQGYDYEDFDDDDINNNSTFGTLPLPLLHHSYTRTYNTGEPMGDISETDWKEAGPSGLNLRGEPPKKRMVTVDVGAVADPPPVKVEVTDSDISSSCSHHSLVDRYTHMNISGCEDQTDEECAFDESDDPLEED